MINKLHMAMIGLYHGDAKRIQHFCKVHSYAKLIAEMENVPPVPRALRFRTLRCRYARTL